MIVVLSVCNQDEPLALLNLELCLKLDGGKVPYECILSADTNVDISRVQPLAESYFSKVTLFRYIPWEGEKSWPFRENWAWQCTARHMAKQSEFWLWWEADATPVRKGWLSTLDSEYIKGGKPFMGHWLSQNGVNYMAGMGVYPCNVALYCSAAFICRKASFDMVLGPFIASLCHRANHLIIHSLEPFTFESFGKFVELERRETVLVHKIKDGSLARMILGVKETAPLEEKPVTLLSRAISVFKGLLERPVVIRRTAALGDIIMATFLVEKLRTAGIGSAWQSRSYFHPALNRVPELRGVTEPKSACHIDLDQVTEKHPDRRKRHWTQIYLESANIQLDALGVSLASSANCTPVLTNDGTFNPAVLKRVESFPKPWVMVCSQSANSPHRRVDGEIWAKVAEFIQGTLFWLDRGPAPTGIQALNIADVESLILAISCADLVVSVNTGTMHAAAALGVPQVVVNQSHDAQLQITDQRDFGIFSPPLDCLNCMVADCPLDAKMPPCRTIDPAQLAVTINRRLGILRGKEVSAIIPTYNAPVERLNRCLAAVLPQVNEVVLTIDHGGSVPPGLVKDPKLQVIQKEANHRLGYGRQINFAARHTNSPWLLLLNDDVFLAPDAVARMKELIDQDVGVIGQLLRFPNGVIQHGGCERCQEHWSFTHVDAGHRNPKFTQPTEMEMVTFASALVRRKAFYGVLGFDEQYDMYNEDCDTSMKLRRAGWKIMYQPSATGIHLQGASSAKVPEIQSIGQRSRELFKRKWGWYWEKNKNNLLGKF